MKRKILLLFLALSACGPADDVASVVVEAEPIPRAGVVVGAPVEATIEKLELIARTGSHRDMAKLASQTDGFHSNNGGLDHQSYWYLKLRTGDWPMAHVGRVLSYPPGVEETEAGRVYVWPYMALLKPRELTAKSRRDTEMLLGPVALARFESGAKWPGYRLGIREDGTWIYFYTSDE